MQGNVSTYLWKKILKNQENLPRLHKLWRKGVFLLCLHSYNKISQPGCLINNKYLFLTDLETEVQDQGASSVGVSEGSFFGLEMASSLCSHMAFSR